MALNEFQPRLLVCYASMVGILAGAQLEGDLRIAPSKVIAASEVLPADARAAAERAWGAGVVVDTYAATETASIASTCEQGGWHLYEDFVVAESVDDDYRPVPPGSRGNPAPRDAAVRQNAALIRYELTDAVRLAAWPLRVRSPLRAAGGSGGPHGGHVDDARCGRAGACASGGLPQCAGVAGPRRLAGRADGGPASSSDLRVERRRTAWPANAWPAR